VDEVGYAFPITAKGASLDLQRVEVLKGPQGTLFGQNSTGGAVNYIAAKPTPDFSAGIYSSLNNYGRLQVGGHVGGGLTDTLTVRVSGEATEGGPAAQRLARGS
jgi:iron complex outermembrane receptor protein